MPNFNDFVEGRAKDLPNFLPFCHTCESYHLRSILQDKCLEANRCEVYKENLVYLFYGKPSYRSYLAGSTANLNAILPACIILKPTINFEFKRVSPFDTGGFESKLYKPYMHKNMSKEDFLLTNTKESAPKLINVFFANNERYFDGRPLSKETLNISFIDFEVESYHNMVSDTTGHSDNNLDDRCCTIEIQSSKPLNINIEDVEQLILPFEWLNDDKAIDLLEDWDDVIVPYRTYNKWRNHEYHGVIVDLVREHMIKKQYISDEKIENLKKYKKSR